MSILSFLNFRYFLCAFSTFLLNASTAFAAQQENFDFRCLKTDSVYLSLQGGISFSQHSSLEVQTGDPALDWDPAPEGYNHDLSNSEVLGAAIGYVMHPAVAVEIEASHRDSFQYSKFQSATALTPSKTRYFDLKNTNVMANLVLNGSGLFGFAYQAQDWVIDPYILGGLGMAFNNISDFYSLRAGNIISGLMQPYTIRSFAYQLGAGLNIRTCKRIGLGLNYRYLDAGTFSSNHFISAGFSGASDPARNGFIISPWKGTLRTQELFLSLVYFI